MYILEGTGAYSPLLLAPAEDLGSPSGPLPSGGNLFNKLIRKQIPGKSIDWSMILSKSNLRDPLNPFFSSDKLCVSTTKKMFDHLTTMPNFRCLNWVLVDPIRPPTFFLLGWGGGTSKNWWLDPKVYADPSWLLVIKNYLKKCSSLKNYWVIDVWSQCKKCDKEEGTQLGFGVLICKYLFKQ